MFNQLLMCIAYLAVFTFAQRQVSHWIRQQAKKKQVNEVRSRMVTRLISYFMFFVTLSVMAISLGLGYQEVSLFVSSAFAVLGVALFAQWSILSNITSGIIIFFNHFVKLDDTITIMDKEFNIEGKVSDIGLFFVIIETKEKERISIPSNLFIQKMIKKTNKLMRCNM